MFWKIKRKMPAVTPVQEPLPPVALIAPDSSLSLVLLAIEDATIVSRHPDDDGPRVMVASPAMGNWFFYERNKAETRIRKRFPDLSDDGVAKVIRALEIRVKYAARSKEPEKPRKKYSCMAPADPLTVGWGHDRHER
ncbi:hypothetical protein [Solilutibacter silvestris]|uniref:Uncharacterized protein n=1 Tax=Solilutibacter silvestris TaxID=1645665 RepID=A0A2K1Q3F3_9GAMM|nr:hypothetical protein [Lysobacter silvestris]PNS09582.1 hypothetical protein Lysil_1211 [Lysobacter silvestris]